MTGQNLTWVLKGVSQETLADALFALEDILTAELFAEAEGGLRGLPLDNAVAEATEAYRRAAFARGRSAVGRALAERGDIA